MRPLACLGCGFESHQRHVCLSLFSAVCWFPGMVFTYFLNDFGMVPVAPVITGITLVFTFHIRSISIIIIIIIIIFYYDDYYYHHHHLWLCSPAPAMASSSSRFLDHIQRRAAVGRTPLDE
jgi:hypothetical protein